VVSAVHESFVFLPFLFHATFSFTTFSSSLLVSKLQRHKNPLGGTHDLGKGTHSTFGAWEGQLGTYYGKQTHGVHRLAFGENLKHFAAFCVFFSLHLRYQCITRGAPGCYTLCYLTLAFLLFTPPRARTAPAALFFLRFSYSRCNQPHGAPAGLDGPCRVDLKFFTILFSRCRCARQPHLFLGAQFYTIGLHLCWNNDVICDESNPQWLTLRYGLC
jgi:hypothetical protein